MTIYKKFIDVSFVRTVSLAVLFVFILSLGFVSSANAQSASYPNGCTSALGYSVTTGQTCNGNSNATIGPLPGCSTALGYSTANGAPCSGGPFAISYLAGCSSTSGYSTIN